MSKYFNHRLAVCLLLILGCTPIPVISQVNNPAYADYFLVGRFGEICTMCEAIVLCETGVQAKQYERVPEAGDFTIYHLQTRTFWSQVATIWEWFVRNFDSNSLAQSGHTRPVNVYEITGGLWSGPEALEAHIALEPAIIEIGRYTIDRVERAWLDSTASTPTGYCQRMPLWESLEIINRHQPAGDTS
ncbi:MAG: hypothetical protein QF803_04240 [Gammaproteobacteria bacterium]|nr:hypothetical protein [Gammaproteobacteria bacterium]MDP6694814.1 hypothetical protein [Gammaproteobacteria bacterium]